MLLRLGYVQIHRLGDRTVRFRRCVVQVGRQALFDVTVDVVTAWLCLFVLLRFEPVLVARHVKVACFLVGSFSFVLTCKLSDLGLLDEAVACF